MPFVRRNRCYVAVFLVSLVGLTACQTPTDVVTPQSTLVEGHAISASDWMTIGTDAWTINTQSPRLHIAGFIDKTVTKEVVERGLVAAFYRDPATGRVCSLPARFGDRMLSFTYYAMNDKGIVSFQENASQPGEGEYRWVVVPKEAVHVLDWNDYEIVSLALHLDE